MATDKLTPNDARVQRKTTDLNGRDYGYLLGEPEGTRRATIFLIHGFPDTSFGWRYVIPMLLKRGLRVVAPDMMGYGMTDAPQYTLKDYGFKRAADDMKELAKKLGESAIILGGHDWGAAIVYRIALYHPTLVSHLFTICIPYPAPKSTYLPTALLAQLAPNFGYQLHLASGEIEEHIASNPTSSTFLIRQFLLSCYGGLTPSGSPAFFPKTGVNLSALPDLDASTTPLVSTEELDHYTDLYTRHGLHGPLNWYRNREINYVDELTAGFVDPPQRGVDPLTQKPKVKIECPVLFIGAERDPITGPETWKSLEKQIPKVTVKRVSTHHWASWEKPDEVNGIIGEWLEGVVGLGGGSKL